VSPGDGQFQICENDSVVASGRITILTDSGTSDDECSTPVHYDTAALSLDADDIYKELRLRGCDYGPTFRGILSADGTGNSQPKWHSRLDHLSSLTLLASGFIFNVPLTFSALELLDDYILTYLLTSVAKSDLSKSHMYEYSALVLTLTSNRKSPLLMFTPNLITETFFTIICLSVK